MRKVKVTDKGVILLIPGMGMELEVFLGRADQGMGHGTNGVIIQSKYGTLKTMPLFVPGRKGKNRSSLLMFEDAKDAKTTIQAVNKLIFETGMERKKYNQIKKLKCAPGITVEEYIKIIEDKIFWFNGTLMPRPPIQTGVPVTMDQLNAGVGKKEV
jgi:hypothetical protein